MGRQKPRGKIRLIPFRLAKACDPVTHSGNFHVSAYYGALRRKLDCSFYCDAPFPSDGRVSQRPTLSKDVSDAKETVLIVSFFSENMMQLRPLIAVPGF